MIKKQIIEFIIIILLGLTPLLWFHGEQVILGHDSGLTLSPVSHFTDRLFAWTERFGFGNDQTYAIPGFFIHGLEALVASLGFNLQSVQKIVFIFWFLLPGLTMYYFSSKVAKRFNLTYFALPATVLYMFNHFLLQGWFVAERTKFSVYAALPLIMSFLFDWEERKRDSLKTAIFISLTLFVLNGEASLPLFGGLILSIFTFVILFLIKEFSKERVYKVLKLFGLTFLISAFLNAYWLLPYGGFVLQSYSSAVAQAGGLSGILGWLNYVSQESSLINIFRLQGIPEWYLNPLHPYANIFLKNIFLVTVSFLIPLAAFLPLYLVKNVDLRKKVIFFSFLALFSMVFIAGSHPPLGPLYVFLVNFVPGFVAFRNPFYKFAPALWFSYAVLISFTINYFLKKIEISEKLKNLKLNNFLTGVSYLGISILIILYSFPFLNGVFFDYMKGERSMRVVVPQYVLDFGKWSESASRINTKVLALPPPNSENKVDAYKWGYISLSPLTSLLTNAPIINESNYMTRDETMLVEKLYEMIKNNEPGWENYAKLLGIESFLLRKDFAWKLKGSPTDSPFMYEEALENSDLSLIKKFGEWRIYSFRDAVNKNVTVSSRLNYLDGEPTDLGKISSLSFFNPKEPVYVSSINKGSENALKIENDLFLVPKCVSCNLQRKFINTDLFIPVITRDSIFYPIIEFKNKLFERRIKSIAEKVNFHLYNSLRSILALDKLISEQKDFELLKLEVENYGMLLNKLDNSLKNNLNSKYVDINFLIEVSEVLEIEENIILYRNPSNLPGGEVLNSLNQKYSDLQRIKNDIDKYIWKTSDETNKKFFVISNTNAQFDFLYRPNFVNFSPAGVNFTLDGEAQNVKPTFVESGWLSLGKLFLTKGIHRLNIKQPIENLYEGFPLVRLNSTPNMSCFSSSLAKGRKNDVYRVSFQHRRIIGSKKFFVRILPSGIKPNPLDTRNYLLESSSIFDNYTADYVLKDDQKFYFTVCNFSSANKEEFSSSIELKDISIRKIDVSDVVFYKPSSNKNLIEGKFRKESQTKYVISDLANTNKMVVLNESYSKNWILPEVKNSTHFLANGYANGWLVKDKNNSFSIKYKPQDFVYYGFVLSFIALMSSIVYLIYLLLNKKL